MFLKPALQTENNQRKKAPISTNLVAEASTKLQLITGNFSISS